MLDLKVRIVEVEFVNNVGLLRVSDRPSFPFNRPGLRI